jgi:hypothetical protein
MVNESASSAPVALSTVVEMAKLGKVEKPVDVQPKAAPKCPICKRVMKTGANRVEAHGDYFYCDNTGEHPNRQRVRVGAKFGSGRLADTLATEKQERINKAMDFHNLTHAPRCPACGNAMKGPHVDKNGDKYYYCTNDNAHPHNMHVRVGGVFGSGREAFGRTTPRQLKIEKKLDQRNAPAQRLSEGVSSRAVRHAGAGTAHLEDAPHNLPHEIAHKLAARAWGKPVSDQPALNERQRAERALLDKFRIHRVASTTHFKGHSNLKGEKMTTTEARHIANLIRKRENQPVHDELPPLDHTVFPEEIPFAEPPSVTLTEAEKLAARIAKYGEKTLKKGRVLSSGTAQVKVYYFPMSKRGGNKFVVKVPLSGRADDYRHGNWQNMVLHDYPILKAMGKLAPKSYIDYKRGFIIQEYTIAGEHPKKSYANREDWDKLEASIKRTARRKGLVARDLHHGNVIITDKGPKIIDVGLFNWIEGKQPKKEIERLKKRLNA